VAVEQQANIMKNIKLKIYFLFW